MKKVRFGLIGCGLMGREFASAIARWCHLPEWMCARNWSPFVIALSKSHLIWLAWFTENFPSIRQVSSDYRQLLANPEVEAVYCAVPHHMHQEFYCAAIESGKHLMGEKPFGIDKPANQAILAAVRRHPELLVRCSSEFPFFPPVQRIGDMIQQKAFGKIIEVNCGFLHSSDLDPNKPITGSARSNSMASMVAWATSECMPATSLSGRDGDRVNVRAILSNIVTERPDGKGGKSALPHLGQCHAFL